MLSTTITTGALNHCIEPRPSAPGATDLSILHVHNPCTPSSPPTQSSPGFDSVQAQARRDPARLASLVAPRSTTLPVASGQQLMQTANYVIRAMLGTPGQLLFMALDTSADSAWVPSSACTGCPASSAAFSPTASSTYSPLYCSSPSCPQFNGPQCLGSDSAQVCSYNQSYGRDSFVATLSHDSLRLALDVVHDYAFGCVTAAASDGGSMAKQGLLGLGRGQTSLLSQAGPLYSGVFSYCLPSYKSYYFSGSLRLGPVGQPQRIRTTPLLRNPHRPSLYYVNLTGVSVGSVQVAVPDGSFGFDPTTGAGTFIDVGTVITRFVASAYVAIRDEFRKQVGASGGFSSLGAFDTCFLSDASVTAPIVTLHFEGMDLVLPAENALIHSSARPLACLAMAAAPENVNAVVNVIANLQQQNLRVLFDVVNSRVGFSREVCN